MWTGKSPSYKQLRVLGCEAFCHILKEFQDKMAPKSKKCIFLGYGEPREMGFGLWDPEARKIVRSRSVFFIEEKMHKNPVKTIEVIRVIFQEDGHENAGEQQQVAQRQEEARVREDEQVVEAQPIVRWSTRVSRPPD